MSIDRARTEESAPVRSRFDPAGDRDEKGFGGGTMLEMDLLREAFRQRRERLEQLGRSGEGEKKRPSPKDRLQETSLADAAKKVLQVIDKVPDVRRDRVEEIKKGLKEGSLHFDSKSVADRLLQESILNELL